MVAESVGGCETEGESDMDVPEVALDAEDMKRRRNDMFLWRVFGRAVVVVGWWWGAVRRRKGSAEFLGRDSRDLTKLVLRVASRESRRWDSRRVGSMVRALRRAGIYTWSK